MNVLVVGAGRVGSALFHVLTKADQKELYVELQPWRTLDAAELQDQYDLVLIATRDDQIAEAAKKILTKTSVNHLAHVSGSVDVKTLTRFHSQSGVCHPAYSFPPTGDFARLERKEIHATFALSGDPQTVSVLTILVQILGGTPIATNIHGAAYHAMCALIANVSAAHAALCSPVLQDLGVSEKEGALICSGLLSSVACNLRETKQEAWVTGPVMRGDEAKVQEHINALEDHPELQSAYIASLQALRHVSNK